MSAAMTNKATTPASTDARTLAVAFVAILRDWLTADEWVDMVRRNVMHRVNGEPFCASHEFCDSNQAMIDACDSLGVDWADMDATGAAWDLAARGPLCGNEWAE